MKIKQLAIPDVLLLEPKVFGDERGFFYESFNQHKFSEAIGQNKADYFVQDNHSKSVKNVIRGLHYQLDQAQAKLVRVISGAIFDVAVDIRRSSPTFGQWVGATLTAENKHQLWIPVGFAHGFAVLTDNTEVLYKTTDFWAPQHEHCIAWNDPNLAIQWPILENAQLSIKDQQGLSFNDAKVFDS